MFGSKSEPALNEISLQKHEDQPKSYFKRFLCKKTGNAKGNLMKSVKPKRPKLKILKIFRSKRAGRQHKGVLDDNHDDCDSSPRIHQHSDSLDYRRIELAQTYSHVESKRQTKNHAGNSSV